MRSVGKSVLSRSTAGVLPVRWIVICEKDLRSLTNGNTATKGIIRIALIPEDYSDKKLNTDKVGMIKRLGVFSSFTRVCWALSLLFIST